MEPSFQHDDVFPLIALLIVRCAENGVFVTHDQIVSAVLSDPKGASMAAVARSSAKWDNDRQAASNMVAWFSQQITVGNSPWVDFFDRERIGGAWAYRSKVAVPSAMGEDVELSAIEGEPRLFFHLRRERSAVLRKAKIQTLLATGGLPSCEACGLTTQLAFPGLNQEILEVHHRLPLSASPGAVPVTLSDLALLCPNCHRAVHRTKPMLSVEAFRTQVLGPSGGVAV